MLPSLDLRHPMYEKIYFPEISSMFLKIVWHVLLWYSSMILPVSLIYFSLASSLFFWFPYAIFRIFSFIFYLPSFIHKVKHILSTHLFFFLSTLVFVPLLLLWSLLWNLPIVDPLPQLLQTLQICFEQPHDTFLEGSGLILIKSSQVWCVSFTSGFLKR